jgi:signal transduction histidine kinase
MSRSVARQVATSSTAILVMTLLLVGVGTGTVLHVQRVDDLDETLLAAAHGRAHPDPDSSIEVEVEDGRSPVETWLVRRGDRRVPAELTRAALERETAFYADIGERRVVLLPFEWEEGEHESKRVAAASAPRLTLRRSVGTFALIYAAIATFAALAAMVIEFWLVRRAFRPLVTARREADRVAGFVEGARLTETGPVELRSLLTAINALLDRLESAHRAQTRFTAEAAHELRTPVTAMLGEIDVALRSERSDEEYRQLLSSVREEVDDLRELVEALTALARIDAGQASRGRELVRAGEVVADAAAAERSTLEEAGSALRLEVADDPELEIQRSLVRVALSNLVRNAARHAPGADVVISVHRDGDDAVFTVDDAGPGIPIDQREALFDRFARSGEARRRDRSGLGLGLPIAREIARRHGGDCRLDDSPLGGLRARLTLPVAST